MDGAVDLLMSDLPGEWTTELVSENRVSRLEFLKRADMIWAVLDGDKLRQLETRQVARHRVDLLARRLGAFLMAEKPPLIFVVTRRDHGGLGQDGLAELRGVGTNTGFDTDVVEVACFADKKANARPGQGIGELVEKTAGARLVMGGGQIEDVVDSAFTVPDIGLTRGDERHGG